MRIVLQTMDHGLQYKLAHQIVNERIKKRDKLKIIEISQIQKPKSFKQRILFYKKRGKLFQLIMNLIGRILKKQTLVEFAKKTALIDKNIGKLINKTNLSVRAVNSLENAKKEIADWEADVVLVIGSPFLPKAFFIDNVDYINLHLGKIPEYRGLKCIEWAILKDELDAVGFTVHQLTEKLDYGDIYSFEKINIQNKSLSQIYAECYKKGIETAVSVTLNKQRRPIMKPSSAGKLYYSIDFNGFVISKLMKKIKL